MGGFLEPFSAFSSSVLREIWWKVRTGIFGVLHISCGIFLLTSLISYSPEDVSYNVESSCALYQNLWGPWGAFFADVLFQCVGTGAFVWAGGWLWTALRVFQKKNLWKPAWWCFFWGCLFSFFQEWNLFFGPFRWMTRPLSFLWASPSLSSPLLEKHLQSFPNALPHVLLSSAEKILPHEVMTYVTSYGPALTVTIVFLFFARMLYKRFLHDTWHDKSKRFWDRRENAQKKVNASKTSSSKSYESKHYSSSSRLMGKANGMHETESSPEKPSHGKSAAKNISSGPLDLSDMNEHFTLPPLSLLHKSSSHHRPMKESDLLHTQEKLQEVLEDFGIKGRVLHGKPGPIVTLYEMEPAAGVKSSRIISLSDDIARSMSALSARVAVIPGKNLIGIELSNEKREVVQLGDILASPYYTEFSGDLALVLGKDISGKPVVVDLARMPHALVAGTTGSGKSVGINSMILSLLYSLSPERCRLLLVDPKMLEFSVYEGIPHLLCPVITEPSKAISALKWAVQEMESRYRLMSQMGVRNIAGYNQKVENLKRHNEKFHRKIQLGFDEKNNPITEMQTVDVDVLPFIVVVIDEMADLMLVTGKEVETLVQRLSQMARAAGIHLIMATQRPSVDVITGTIKANFPTRISFQVTSKIDSRTILGEQGAEHLLGQGDMLYMASGGRITRVHGPFVSDTEIEDVAMFLKKQRAPNYIDIDLPEESAAHFSEAGGDSLYQEAVTIIKRDGRVSISYLQRKLQIGYNRAAGLVERMEQDGIISSPNHSGKREVLG